MTLIVMLEDDLERIDLFTDSPGWDGGLFVIRYPCWQETRLRLPRKRQAFDTAVKLLQDHDDIYAELAKHKQIGWASCEGTNLQLGSGPGQSGMNMETYLAKMFNHGATLVNIFSWGIGGEAHKNMSFRVVTEGEEALQAYRKFLQGTPLIEAKTETLKLLDRLPPKIRKIQKELPPWIQKTGNKEALALMQNLQAQLKAKNFEAVEKTADAILSLMSADQ